MLWLLPIIGAAAGLVKNELVDKPEYDKQVKFEDEQRLQGSLNRTANIEATRNRPFLSNPSPLLAEYTRKYIQEPSALQGALGGATAGLTFAAANGLFQDEKSSPDKTPDATNKAVNKQTVGPLGQAPNKFSAAGGLQQIVAQESPPGADGLTPLQRSLNQFEASNARKLPTFLGYK